MSDSLVSLGCLGVFPVPWIDSFTFHLVPWSLAIITLGYILDPILVSLIEVTSITLGTAGYFEEE